MRTLCRCVGSLKKHGIRKSLLLAYNRIRPYMEASIGKLYNPYSVSQSALLHKAFSKRLANTDELRRLLEEGDHNRILDYSGTPAIVTFFREHYPDEVHKVFTQAQEICDRRFYFLGKHFDFNGVMGWHFDPISGTHWPLRYYKLIDLHTPRRLGDCRVVWELNRHQYFITLGKAYLITGDEKYVRGFCTQVLSWIEDNPVLVGINWISPMEVGIRLVSWILSYALFKNSRHFRMYALPLFLKSAYEQVRYLEKNLTVHWKVRNNHIIAEAASLALFGLAFPEFKASKRWIEKGLNILERELEDQNYADGVNKENALCYHRFVVDIVVLVVISLQRRGIPVPDAICGHLERMLEFIMLTTGPDGRCPMIGDSDDGRGYYFSESKDFWDFRGSLSIGAVLFHRGDFKFVAERFYEEAFWCLGIEGYEKFDKTTSEYPRKWKVFEEGGYFVTRDRWDDTCDLLIVKSGNFGLGGDGWCAHGHCDLLSVNLWINGVYVLEDCGTYSYHDICWRDMFRGTRAHNVVVMDGYEQAIPDKRGPFGWQSVSRANIVDYSHNSVKCRFRPLELNDMLWEREVTKQYGKWYIKDVFVGQGQHSLEWYFQFSPDLNLRLSEKKVLISQNESALFKLQIPPEMSNVALRRTWMSYHYGERIEHFTLLCSWKGLICGEKSFQYELARVEK